MNSTQTKINYIKAHYIPLLSQFLSHSISPELFQMQYMKVMQEDPYDSPCQEIFNVLQAIFEDADAYDAEAVPEDAPCLITEQELREGCIKHYHLLQQLLTKETE